jgi:alpha-L-fucosidase
MTDIISSLVETVSCGGNVLINIGPTKEGTIPVIFQQRLEELGSWLKVNGEAIYGTKPWTHQNDTTNGDVWYTLKDDIVYAILLKYPTETKKVTLGAPQTSDATKISILGYDGTIQWVVSAGGLNIDLSNIQYSSLQSNWAWVIKLVNVT